MLTEQWSQVSQCRYGPNCQMRLTIVLTMVSIFAIVVIVYIRPFKTSSFTWVEKMAPTSNKLFTNTNNSFCSRDNLLCAAMKIHEYSRTIMVAVVNDAYLPFAYNWLCNTKGMGLHKNVLIITTDNKSSESLKRDWPEVSTISMNVNNLSGNKNFQQAGYLRVNIKRHQYLYRLLKEGYEILHFDLDQFWVRNPLPFLQGHKDYDILVTKVSRSNIEYCSGFVFVFNSDRTIKLWELQVKRLLEEGRKIASYNDTQKVPESFMDQAPWSKIIKSRTVPGLVVKELSLEEFSDGYFWYKKSKEERDRLSLDPFVIHNNFIIGNGAKIKRAKAFNHWFLNANMTCNTGLVKRSVKLIH